MTTGGVLVLVVLLALTVGLLLLARRAAMQPPIGRKRTPHERAARAEQTRRFWRWLAVWWTLPL